MSLQGDVIRLAHEKPELREHLVPILQRTGRGRPKRAGFYNRPLCEEIVTPQVIKDTMKRVGGFDMGAYDFSKIKFHPVNKSKKLPHGYEVIWLVFPHGEFDVRESDFVHGTVSIGIKSTNKGAQVTSYITVAI